MSNRLLTIVLSIALAFGAAALWPQLRALRLPGNHQGFEPTQPIAYSHRLHAGELQIPCQYCHSGAQRSRMAGIPAASVCMNCHRVVTAARSTVRAEEKAAEREGRAPRPIIAAELAKLYDALGLDEKLVRDPARPTHPIAWVRIHEVPDFVAFDHRPHVTAGIACQKCHGPIETMERVRQVKSLSMGWCINCHRAGVATAASAASGASAATASAASTASAATTTATAATTATTANTELRRGSTDCAVCHY